MLWFAFQILTWPTISIVAKVLLLRSGNIATATNPNGTASNLMYSRKELKAIAQLRDRVKDILDNSFEQSDTFIIPWIRASDLNIEKAEETLRASKQWRKDERIDGILNETIATRFPQRFCLIFGIGKEGHPVVYLNNPWIDLRKLMITGKAGDFSRRLIQCLEETVHSIRKLGIQPGQSICVFNFEGYNIRQNACTACIKLYLNFLHIVEDFYPRLAKHLVVINVPTIAKPLTDLAKRVVMSSYTGEVLKIFGSSKRVWSSYLLTLISADQLPIYFGGNAISPMEETEARAH